MKAFNEYPPSYFALLESVARDGKAMYNELSLGDARSLRHSFYRFVRSISATYEADPSNKYLKTLYPIASEITIKIRPTCGTYDTTATITFQLNPLTIAMRGAT